MNGVRLKSSLHTDCLSETGQGIRNEGQCCPEPQKWRQRMRESWGVVIRKVMFWGPDCFLGNFYLIFQENVDSSWVWVWESGPVRTECTANESPTRAIVGRTWRVCWAEDVLAAAGGSGSREDIFSGGTEQFRPYVDIRIWLLASFQWILEWAEVWLTQMEGCQVRAD